jgi:hypothetical protein
VTRPCISDVRATEDLGRDFDPDAVVNGQNPEFTDFHLWPRLLAGLGRSDPADGRIPRFGERSDVATVALREEVTAVGVELLSWTTGTPPRTWLVRALFLPPESEMSLRVLSARTCCSTAQPRFRESRWTCGRVFSAQPRITATVVDCDCHTRTRTRPADSFARRGPKLAG